MSILSKSVIQEFKAANVAAAQYNMKYAGKRILTASEEERVLVLLQEYSIHGGKFPREFRFKKANHGVSGDRYYYHYVNDYEDFHSWLEHAKSCAVFYTGSGFCISVDHIGAENLMEAVDSPWLPQLPYMGVDYSYTHKRIDIGIAANCDLNSQYYRQYWVKSCLSRKDRTMLKACHKLNEYLKR